MKFVFLLCFISHSSLSNAQYVLSEDAEIAIATFGPYQGEVWSAFGHNGIRIIDPTHGVDWFYDYGLYDFKQKNFFLNFARGLLLYKVGVRKWEQTLAYHSSLERTIRLQYLNLTREEKQWFFDYLQHNVRPENAEYEYNYVFENCATKIRDVSIALFGDRIEFDLRYKEQGKTIRALIDDYLHYQPWGKLGIDIGLGQQIDREATAEEYMFLPDYIYAAFQEATLERGGVKMPLVKRSEEVYIPDDQDTTIGMLSPLNVFILFFFFVGLITHQDMKYKRRTAWIDTLLFSTVGFIGWWVVFLWLGTAHLSKWNLNILWAIPLHLPLIFFVSKERFRLFMKRYFTYVSYGYVLLLLCWSLLPQPLSPSLIPLVLTMILRGGYLSYFLKTPYKKETRTQNLIPPTP